MIIGTTTEIEYSQRLAPISALAENSQIVRVPEPSVDETAEMLKILKPHLEADYQWKLKRMRWCWRFGLPNVT